ncbi:MAG: hypothetical protein D8G53_03285 [Candidatus Saccharimonas sp.]|nr:MAG: hypothetical protein D8G53_03285 [Candidatus Saccharimonas sp.]
MSDRKRNRVEDLVRAIDYAKEKISYWERLRESGDYDVLIRRNSSDAEPEVIENGCNIVDQIIYNYKQSLERYNEELDRLLAPKVTGNEQYEQHEPRKRWFFRK